MKQSGTGLDGSGQIWGQVRAGLGSGSGRAGSGSGHLGSVWGHISGISEKPRFPEKTPGIWESLSSDKGRNFRTPLFPARKSASVPPDFSRSKMHNRTLKAVYRGGPVGAPRGAPRRGAPRARGSPRGSPAGQPGWRGSPAGARIRGIPGIPGIQGNPGKSGKSGKSREIQGILGYGHIWQDRVIWGIWGHMGQMGQMGVSNVGIFRKKVLRSGRNCIYIPPETKGLFGFFSQNVLKIEGGGEAHWVRSAN